MGGRDEHHAASVTGDFPARCGVSRMRATPGQPAARAAGTRRVRERHPTYPAGRADPQPRGRTPARATSGAPQTPCWASARPGEWSWSTRRTAGPRARRGPLDTSMFDSFSSSSSRREPPQLPGQRRSPRHARISARSLSRTSHRCTRPSSRAHCSRRCSRSERTDTIRSGSCPSSSWGRRRFPPLSGDRIVLPNARHRSPSRGGGPQLEVAIGTNGEGRGSQRCPPLRAT